MSRTNKSAYNTRQALINVYKTIDAEKDINNFLKYGHVDEEHRFWELTQEEADDIYDGRRACRGTYKVFIESLKAKGKSRGARYIASRIWNGAAPNLEYLTKEWYAYKNITRELSNQELDEIEAKPGDLVAMGMYHRWEARKFYELYRQLRDPKRVRESCKQVSQWRILKFIRIPKDRKSVV